MTIFHFVTPSVMTDAFRTLPGARVLQYHNITPAHFFAPFSPEIARLTILARRDLATLADRTDLALGDSTFNREELDGLGFRHTGVMPILVDTDRLTDAEPVESLSRVLDDDLVNILFVGRIAPNKKIEDHIRLAEALQALRRHGVPIHLRRQGRRRAALHGGRSRVHARAADAAGAVSVHRAPCRPRAARPTIVTRTPTSR